jgi:hypothetical protein
LRYLTLLTLLIVSLFAESPNDKKKVFVSKIGEDKYRMKVFFNYENPYQTHARLVGRATQYAVKLPIQDKFKVTSLKIHVKYTPSLVLYHARSSIAVVSNGLIIRQFSLNEERYKDVGSAFIKASIPVNTLRDYNDIGVQIIQHYSSGRGKEDIEDPSAPELWSQVDLDASYLEFEFQPKFFEEKLSSIKKFMFDNKAILKESVNFVFPKKPTKDDFYYYGFMANAIGQILKFKDIDFTVSTKLIDKRNNVLIMGRDDAKKVLLENSEFYAYADLDNKLSGNINLLRNYNRPDKGILVIAGDNRDEISSALYSLLNSDTLILEEQNLKVTKTEIPYKARPYTSPGFISPGSKVYFSDLGYETRTFSGEQADRLNLNFKLYPTVKYKNTDMLESNLEVIYSSILREDSATNVYVNGNFAYQLRASSLVEQDDSAVKSSSSQRFEIGKKKAIPTKLLRKGSNTLTVEFALVPIHGPQLIRFNDSIIKTVVRDDSFITFPSADTQVEMPNLQYIAELAFPFSIYPDLQNTGILITDFDSRTIASAMYIAFILGKQIPYPAYYLTVTPDINDVVMKDIIHIGKQIDIYSLLYKHAPIKFTKDGVVKEIAVSSKFVQKDGVRHKEFLATTKSIEDVDFNDYLLVQAYKSPFDNRRVVVEVSGKKPETLLRGVRNGFTPEHLNSFSGDVWLYNIAENDSYSYQVKETYILDGLVDGEDKKMRVEEY